MNAQEIFDATVEHLKGMTKRAVKEVPIAGGETGDQCMYLAADGSQCAIGFRIPEEHPGLEYKGRVRELIKRYPDLEHVLLPADMDRDTGLNFLTMLQRAHDTVYHWDADGLNGLGYGYLHEIADKYGLTYE